MLLLGPSEIESAISYGELLTAVENAFIIYETGHFSMPDRLHAEYQGNVLLSMPAFNESGSGVKLVSVFPGNPRHGEPMIQGLMILNDSLTGKPLAIMDASKLTAMRTGAVGAMGVKYLAGKSSRKLGLIGTGVQAWYLIQLSCTVHEFTEVHVYDIDAGRAEGFSSRLRKETGINAHVSSNSGDLLNRSEVIITATTSKDPVLPEDPGLLEGKTYIAVGSYKPEVRELPKSLYPLLGKVYLDSWLATEESGDLSFPLKMGWIITEQIHSLGNLMTGTGSGPEDPTRLFKTVGMGLFDLLAGQKILELALQKGIGLEVNFNQA